MMAPAYRGRFAPSPTGPLHLGSLSTALAGFLDARSAHGTWSLRIEDIDPPREQPNAGARIIASLRRHALHWDGDPLHQSTRHDAYAQALACLLATGKAFHCTCSRKELHLEGNRHAAGCPRSQRPPSRPSSIRLQATHEPSHIDDLILGTVMFSRPGGTDDLILRRRDGLYAYQLAVVVDDAWQGITHVVRGRDLLDSTPHQILLHRLLGAQPPRFAHVPLLLDVHGDKLSKQNHAPALDDTRAASNLLYCLRVLGQPPPPAELHDDCHAILQWAVARWDRARVPVSDHVMTS